MEKIKYRIWKLLVHMGLTEDLDRSDEQLAFGLDIGAGKNKICPLGCDLQKKSDIQCDMQMLPFQDKSFVLSVFRHSLEHVQNRGKALDEARRVSYFTFVILPKEHVWHKDKTHTPFFTLEGKKIRTFAWSECYLV